MMVFKQLKRLITNSSWLVKVVLLIVISIELALWTFGRLYPIDSEIYFSLLSPIAISGGSLPILFIFLSVYLKNPPLFEKIRQPRRFEFKLCMLFILMSSFIISTVPIIIFIIMALLSNNIDIIKLDVILEIIIRHFMFLFVVGSIQYLGTLIMKNKYIIPCLLLGSFISLSFMTNYRLVSDIFIFTQPPINNKGNGLPLLLLIPLFLFLSILITATSYEILMRKDTLGGYYD